ncbi:hypothetical protein CHLRE_17g720256v5 [Chlamydomonas reinhardtii]|uniref:Uncharacterized protein n=1 Tax=Chlamydomonas reinhardtii TaxID=3055 RepID=A0A2K3CQ91_CHLRE|nr:uncharacterized protein CHLRE_17g720256v5 [Chlamydomonas reinhardtii]PNW70450.1 hypothetical protein CHLRE_17g720256v5 [Chlamydomonas reinhardtii]
MRLRAGSVSSPQYGVQFSTLIGAYRLKQGCRAGKRVRSKQTCNTATPIGAKSRCLALSVKEGGLLGTMVQCAKLEPPSFWLELVRKCIAVFWFSGAHALVLAM